MKIVTLFFACVAFLNFAKVSAMDDRGEVGRGRYGRGGVRSTKMLKTTFPNPHPDLAAWTNHGHNHPTEIQNPDPNHQSRPQRRIIISKVVDHGPSEFHFLIGELVPDLRIASCNGPFGYAIVDLKDSERLYACLKPRYHHNEAESSKQTGGAPEFIAYVIREGMVPRRLEGALTTGDARITLGTTTGEFARPGMREFGHVRYIKSDPNNPTISINAAGDIYNFTQEGPR